MQPIKNKIIKSLIKQNLIRSEKDILSMKLVDRGLINYIFSIKLHNKALIAKYATNFCRFAPHIKVSEKRLENELRQNGRRFFWFVMEV